MSLLLRGCVELVGETPKQSSAARQLSQTLSAGPVADKARRWQACGGQSWPVYREGNAAGTTCLGDGILVEGHGLSHATKPQADRGTARGSTLAAQYFSTAITSKK
jgi:hypothetical protein